ncbi:MAG TPA: hypothetical protein PKK11_04490 [Methanothrix sp.]|nr:hypothetical protein [Methanothrix sp.]
MSGERDMQDGTGQSSEKEDGAKERCDYFWHTYYGLPSEMLGWALLAVTLSFLAFVASVAMDIL